MLSIDLSQSDSVIRRAIGASQLNGTGELNWGLAYRSAAQIVVRKSPNAFLTFVTSNAKFKGRPTNPFAIAGELHSWRAWTAVVVFL